MPITDKGWLVIGYGNDLRGDDAVGPQVVDKIAEMDLANVRTITGFQLLPEMAAEAAEADSVVFVDAAVDLLQVSVERIVHMAPSAITHIGSPHELISLSRAVYGSDPAAWFVKIPALQFELGAPLSELTERCAREAVDRIRGLIEG